MNDKIPEGTSSFTWWVKYPQEPPKTLAKEDLGEGYQSSYVFCWNFIKDRGWKREAKMWVSPDNKCKYNNVYDAYRCQMLTELIESK